MGCCGSNKNATENKTEDRHGQALKKQEKSITSASNSSSKNILIWVGAIIVIGLLLVWLI